MAADPTPVKRPAMIGVRTTHEIRDSVALAAKEDGLTISSWCERAIVAALAKRDEEQP